MANYYKVLRLSRCCANKHSQSSKAVKEDALLKYRQVSEAYEIRVDDRKRSNYYHLRYGCFFRNVDANAHSTSSFGGSGFDYGHRSGGSGFNGPGYTRHFSSNVNSNGGSSGPGQPSSGNGNTDGGSSGSGYGQSSRSGNDNIDDFGCWPVLRFLFMFVCLVLVATFGLIGLVEEITRYYMKRDDAQLLETAKKVAVTKEATEKAHVKINECWRMCESCLAKALKEFNDSVKSAKHK